MDTYNWRTEMPPGSRERIVNKIMETLKRHLPFSGQEIKEIAVRFEEKMYTAAMNQSDYLRKISLKMLAMESNSQNTIPNSLPPNPSGNNNSDSGGIFEIANLSLDDPVFVDEGEIDEEHEDILE
ncbi:mediator of RNA polymerase II transcription subunit 15a-like isoform X1 [Euphorbia lathyris]|uniref:mediator of RNA polymerase II transcription subunit 15a-like isoform X1 n=2 Tax=Euphorbia lathyris TaxID=212925 RepID=UPI0033138C02